MKIVDFTEPKLSGVTLIGTDANNISKTDVTTTAGSTVYQKDTISIDDIGDLSKGYLLNNQVLNFKLPAGLTLKTDSVTVDEDRVEDVTNNAGVYSLRVPDSVKLTADKKTVALSYAYTIDSSVAAESSIPVGATTLSGDLYNGTTKLGPVTSRASNSATINIIAPQLSIDKVPSKYFFGEGDNPKQSDPQSGLISTLDAKLYDGKLATNGNKDFQVTVKGYSSWVLSATSQDSNFTPLSTNGKNLKFSTDSGVTKQSLTALTPIYTQESKATTSNEATGTKVFSDTLWFLDVNPFSNGKYVLGSEYSNTWENVYYQLSATPNS